MSGKKDYRKMKNTPLQKRADVIQKLTEKSYKLVKNLIKSLFVSRVLFLLYFQTKDHYKFLIN
jgi:hypothetical protein